MDNMGYPKLEIGLSLMSKDHLVDCLAYNILKVCAYSFPRCWRFETGGSLSRRVSVLRAPAQMGRARGRARRGERRGGRSRA
jgi:hypothetical protein